MSKTLLVIGYTLPEPNTTAAGSRMMQLLSLFQEADYSITFATTARASEKAVRLDDCKIYFQKISLNDASFDTFISELNPTIVLFDRFITEEQFGWRVSQFCPNALQILDTEDLHFLRKARQLAVKENKPLEQANLHSEVALREVASIFRCDLSLIISEVEKELLEKTFQVPSAILQYLPFLLEAISEEESRELPSFQKREHFMTIGNLLHAPNVDSVKQLKLFIWPQIRKALPEARLFVYGAYAPQQILEFHNEAEGFIVKGWVADASEVFKKARICLAPLQFGAGLKGKLLDAMRYGLPSISTKIGAEGMVGKEGFPGIIEDSWCVFAEQAIHLYQNESAWSQFQELGYTVIEKRFQKTSFSSIFMERITALRHGLSMHRQSNFIGMMLKHHNNQASKYLSKWIEEKNKKS